MCCDTGAVLTRVSVDDCCSCVVSPRREELTVSWVLLSVVLVSWWLLLSLLLLLSSLLWLLLLLWVLALSSLLLEAVEVDGSGATVVDVLSLEVVRSFEVVVLGVVAGVLVVVSSGGEGETAETGSDGGASTTLSVFGLVDWRLWRFFLQRCHEMGIPPSGAPGRLPESATCSCEVSQITPRPTSSPTPHFSAPGVGTWRKERLPSKHSSSSVSIVGYEELSR